MKSDKKVLYKKTWGASEDGVTVFTEKWIAVHETPCFYFCVREHSVSASLEFLKQHKLLKRVSKTSSRFAFDTEQKALDHLRFLKRKQLSHMERDTVLIKALLAATDKDLLNGSVPDTKNLVAEYYVFD
jgi:hypothetical protein